MTETKKVPVRFCLGDKELLPSDFAKEKRQNILYMSRDIIILDIEYDDDYKKDLEAQTTSVNNNEPICSVNIKIFTKLVTFIRRLF